MTRDKRDDWQPGGRTTAPGRLGVVQAFLNTVNLELGHEALDSPRAAAAWLHARGLAPTPPELDDADLARLLAARRALRALLRDGSIRPEGQRALQAEVHLEPGMDGNGLKLQTDGAPVDQALGRLLVDILVGQADGTWARLKTCQRESCQWIFYDRSRNRSSHWCSSRVCGMRTNVEAYRRRTAATTQDT